MVNDLAILGGGPAGLAAGYYAQKNGLNFTIYEAQAGIGGNAVTFKHGDFLLDSGAHRFHDKNPQITEEIKNLLGPDLLKISIPSHIYHQGKLTTFPLAPFNLFKNIGPYPLLKIVLERLAASGQPQPPPANFKELTLATYGRFIAEKFLLGYSEKLWGRPSGQLSLQVSGNRLKSLNFTTFAKEILYPKRDQTEHLDGSFYYPCRGIGMIAEKLAEACGTKNIRTQARVTKLYHRRGQIEAIEINQSEKIPVHFAVSSLPLPLLLQLLHPLPPEPILAAAGKIHFRSLILVGLFINRRHVTRSGSVYFPEPDFRVTRLHEPKNRSRLMSPVGKTSLVAEIPGQLEDEFWQMSDANIGRYVQTRLIELKWIKEQDILDRSVWRLKYAYPILEVGFEEKIKIITDYLSSFENLRVIGRNGRFVYTHLHDLISFGQETIAEYIQSPVFMSRA